MERTDLGCASRRWLPGLLVLLLGACGGRATKGDALTGNDADTGRSANSDDSGPFPESASGDAVDTDTQFDGGITVDPDAATSISVGDFDHISAQFPQLPPNVAPASFFWGGTGAFRLGNWFVKSSSGKLSDAQIDAIEPPRGDSSKACHASGVQFAQGLDLFAQLNHPTGSAVDLSRYAGIVFWTRSASPAKLSVILNDGTGSLTKENSWAGLFSADLVTSPAWQRFELPFSDLTRVTAVTSIDFVILDGGDAVDLWIDDLTFVCRGACQ